MTAPLPQPRHVVVVGMHRSGTSAVAATLLQLGLSLPDPEDVIGPGPFNERGYVESIRFKDINNRVLWRVGGSWSAPPAGFGGEQISSSDPAVRSVAAAFCATELARRSAVLKDPRLCLTLPFWLPLLEHTPAAILVVRDPSEVALSLQQRDGFPVTLGLAIWHRYVRASVTALHGLPVYVVAYRDLVEQPDTRALELATFLTEQGFPVPSGGVARAAAELAPELRHHRYEPTAKELSQPSSLLDESRALLAVVLERRGAHARWTAPPLPPEPAWVSAVIELAAAGEMVAYAAEVAQRELKWIKRSRLFAATRALWRVTSTGPELAPVPVAPGASEHDGARLRQWSSRAKSSVSRRQPVARGLITAEDNPSAPDVIGDFRLFAVIKSWMDEDIIAAAVRNAFVQGVDAVFLVDNGSTDETVERALAAGAQLAENYETEVFDGRLVQPLVNAVVVRESLRSGADHVWWLLLDSDEFPDGPNGLSVKQYLATLDRRFRLVGTTFWNHLPDGKPENVESFHPIDFQPFCYRFVPQAPPCALGHWKHPLQRFDRRGHFLLSNDGAHTAFASEPLSEPSLGIVVHHFQYREEARTRAKLELVCGPGAPRGRLHETAGFAGFERRRRDIDAVYSHHWGDLESLRGASERPQPWPAVSSVLRWYPAEASTTGRLRATSLNES
jgi:hypothetical protein